MSSQFAAIGTDGDDGMRLVGRALTDADRAAIRGNAHGEGVYCGTDRDAEVIARSACDRDAEWSDAAAAEAVQIARDAWEASREEVRS